MLSITFFVGAFAKLWKASSCLSVLMEQLCFCWTDFCEFDIWLFLKKSVQQIKFH